VPRLSLEGVSQATIGVGLDRFSATVGTGLGAMFTDMLNTHALILSVQLNQGTGEAFTFRDTAAYGAYVNQAHRWNWGVIASYIPVYAGVRTDNPGSFNDPARGPVDLLRETQRGATVMTSYPFSRSRRLEFQGGAGQLSFERYTVDPAGDVEWVDAAESLTFGTASAALVGDSTNFGAVSVVRGERYRMEVAPTFGTIRYVNVLADYRRYVMPVPFYTVAARALHFGRYGAGADDPRIPPLYLGYPTLVRGYDLGSRFEAGCVVALSSGCDEIETMLGTRIAVGNAELRFPLLRMFGVSPEMYGPVPAEVAVFVDGGAVWRRQSADGRAAIGTAWSTGVTFRTSVIGLGLGQFDIARPLNRRGAGWVFQFNLAPAL
jgi:outer membrane protein assembly factor BamA